MLRSAHPESSGPTRAVSVLLSAKTLTIRISLLAEINGFRIARQPFPLITPTTPIDSTKDGFPRDNRPDRQERTRTALDNKVANFNSATPNPWTMLTVRPPSQGALWSRDWKPLRQLGVKSTDHSPGFNVAVRVKRTAALATPFRFRPRWPEHMTGIQGTDGVLVAL